MNGETAFQREQFAPTETRGRLVRVEIEHMVYKHKPYFAVAVTLDNRTRGITVDTLERVGAFVAEATGYLLTTTGRE